MMFVSVVYVAAFIGFGLLVSSRARHSGTSLLVLLTGWVVFVVVVPNTVGSLVSALRPIVSPLEFEKGRGAALAENHTERFRSNEYMFTYGSPLDENPRHEALARWAAFLNGKLEVEVRLDDGRLDEQFAQVELARRVLYVSPFVVYKNAMESLAGTGFERHRGFVEAARRLRDQFVTFIREQDAADPESPHVYYVKEGLSKKPVSYGDVPRLEEPTGVGVAMRAALFDTSLLVLLVVLLLVIGHMAFLRAEVT